MVSVYALRLDDLLNEPAYNRLFALASANVQAKLVRFAKRDDAYRSLFGLCLARYALGQCFDAAGNDAEFELSDFGKPLVAGRDDIWFNISHSGNRMACAVHHRPVGIDIECILPIDFAAYKDHFSTQEFADLHLKSGYDQLVYFYNLWTLKESYIKQQGRGLSISLSSFTIVQYDNGFVISDSPGIFFQQYSIDNYSLSVCATEPAFSNIKFVDLGQL